jgi:3-oxoacyl-[acyl-carrier protein] reductase
MDLQLKGKKALVCASSKGLGLAVAKELYSEGCELVICARNHDELIQAATMIANHAGRTRAPHILVTDLANPSSIKDFAKKAASLLGGSIDILVNNVGGPPPSSAEDTSIDAWRNGFDQIFLSAILLTQAILPQMKEQKFGRIITITSVSVIEPIDHLVVSTAMRTAVTTFMKTLSKEMAPYGITANTVQPGVIHTDRIVNLRKSKAERDGTSLDIEMDKTARAIPVGRLGKPEELADLVAFLASPRSSYITGANIPVDGGMRHSWS